MPTPNIKTFKFINRNIDEKIDDIVSWLYAKIVTYNAETNTADVKPLINISDGEGDFVELPIIPSVPVMQYSCSLFSFKIPYQAGDIVRIIFTNTGLEGFMPNGKPQDEDITSKCSLTGCFAIPCEYSSQELSNSSLAREPAVSQSTNSFEITTDGQLQIKMQKSVTIQAGAIKIFTNISNQLGQISESLTQIATALTALGGGATVPPASPSPQPLTIAGDITSTGLQVTSLVDQMQELKQQLDAVI